MSRFCKNCGGPLVPDMERCPFCDSVLVEQPPVPTPVVPKPIVPNPVVPEPIVPEPVLPTPKKSAAGINVVIILVIVFALILSCVMVGWVAVFLLRNNSSETPAYTNSSPYSHSQEVQSSASSYLQESSSQSQSKFASQTPAKDYLTNTKYYVQENLGYGEGYRPYVIFYDNGTFVIEENLYESTGTYSGTYVQSGNALLLTVTNISFKGFLGDNVQFITFAILNQRQLQLRTDLCMCRDNPHFVVL